MIVGALVLQDGTNGMTEASTDAQALEAAQLQFRRHDGMLVLSPSRRCPTG